MDTKTRKELGIGLTLLVILISFITGGLFFAKHHTPMKGNMVPTQKNKKPVAKKTTKKN